MPGSHPHAPHGKLTQKERLAVKLSTGSAVVLVLLVFAFSGCSSIGNGVPSFVKVGACLSVDTDPMILKVEAVEGHWIRSKTSADRGSKIVWVNLDTVEMLLPYACQ